MLLQARTSPHGRKATALALTGLLMMSAIALLALVGPPCVNATDETVDDDDFEDDDDGNANLLPNPTGVMPPIVIIGGGLAGCTAALAAHAELQKAVQLATTTSTDVMPDPVEIILIEKMPKLGGNSAKASSGINALNVPGGDSEDLFKQDTLKSGGDLSKPELVSTLVSQSPAAIKFLESYGIDLSKVTQLGGHSKPRSHTNPVGGNVGWSIMSKITAAVKATPEIRIMESYKMEDIVLNESGAVQGVLVMKADLTHSEDEPAPEDAYMIVPAQAVILAAGGFAANKELLAEHNPEAAALATTNGPWAQGEALESAATAGAHLKDMDQVQIHPTGFVDPADPGSGTKFLAPEKLRGVGAIMLNKAGERFVDELDTRDKVSSSLSSQPGKEAWLVLPEAGADEYGISAIQFYVSKKLMSKVEGVSGLAEHLGVSDKVVKAQLEAYNQAAKGKAKDALGKTVFPAGFDAGGVMYVARVTPVVHYTMGGVEIDAQARALNKDGKPIPGLYAAGEVSAGVHGRNRLGGNSLLECVVFGQIAGTEAAKLATNSTNLIAGSGFATAEL